MVESAGMVRRTFFWWLIVGLIDWLKIAFDMIEEMIEETTVMVLSSGIV